MTRSRNVRATGPVLYAMACGSPPAGHIGQLVELAQLAGWQVCVVATPDGRKFLDVRALSSQTGYPVRCHYKQPGDRDVLPRPDAMLVAPATVNTVNKWACGIADTLALGMLIEGYGLGLPTVAMPYTNTAMAAHPAFQENLQRLRSWGVRVLFGDDVLAMPMPGSGAGHAARFPWRLALAAVGPPRHRPKHTDRAGGARSVDGSGIGEGAGPGDGGLRVEMSRDDGHVPAGLSGFVGNRRRPPQWQPVPAPPTSPRPAPPLHRGGGFRYGAG